MRTIALAILLSLCVLADAPPERDTTAEDREAIKDLLLQQKDLLTTEIGRRIVDLQQQINVQRVALEKKYSCKLGSDLKCMKEAK